MHTAICTFENRADAERAVDRLVQSGFDRADVHMEFRHADGTPVQGSGGPSQGQAPLMHGEPAEPGQANDHWDGMEREVAMDSRVVRRLGHFFERLFGHDEGAGHAGRYAGAVDRGHCVVMVDAHDDASAERAQSLLHGLNPDDMNLVHRAGQRPLRDVVAERSMAPGAGGAAGSAAVAGSLEQRFGTARGEMAPQHNMDVRGEGEFPREAERAIASQGWGEQRRLEIVDEDKPIASPDIEAGHDGEKPR